MFLRRESFFEMGGFDESQQMIDINGGIFEIVSRAFRSDLFKVHLINNLVYSMISKIPVDVVPHSLIAQRHYVPKGVNPAKVNEYINRLKYSL